MIGQVQTVKVGAAVVGVDSAVQVLLAPDPMLSFLGIQLVPQPLFFAALLGAALGVFLLQDKVANQLSEPRGTTRSGRLVSGLLKLVSLGVAVLAFAFLTSAILAAVLDYLTPGPTIHSTPGWIGTAIVLGCFIHRLLPKMQSAWERAIDSTVSAYERVIGGGP